MMTDGKYIDDPTAYWCFHPDTMDLSVEAKTIPISSFGLATTRRVSIQTCLRRGWTHSHDITARNPATVSLRW